MATNLPVPLTFAVNEDIAITFALVDEAGAPVAAPSGTWSLVMRAGARSYSFPISNGVSSNQKVASAAVTALDAAMPAGVLFTGDLRLVTGGGASAVYATVSLVRERVVQDTDDLGARIVQVTRSAGVTVAVTLSAGSALGQVNAAVEDAQDAADLAQAWASQPVGEDVAGAAPGSRSALDRAAAAAGSASAASSSAGAASGSANLAAAWAAQPSGEDVAGATPGSRSALHYAAAAASSAGAASGSASAASGSAGAAAGSASAASTSASNASASASAAAGSASAASGSATTAQGLLDSVSALALTVAAQSTAAQQGAANAKAISQSSLSGVAKAVSASDSVVASVVTSCARDTDGGAWRDKVAHTSWMNEALNTATRGSRAQFPQNFRIEATASLLSVFDLDDPATPLWKSWTVAGLVSAGYFGNGLIFYVANNTLLVFDLILDQVSFIASSGRGVYNQTIATFNQGTAVLAFTGTGAGNSTGGAISVASATILPHTPRNPLRCDLPNPTIAVGTAGGASIIRWDGVVCNSSSTVSQTHVAFMPDGTLVARNSNAQVSLVSPAVYQTASWVGLGVSTNLLGPAGAAYQLRWSQLPSAGPSMSHPAGRRIAVGGLGAAGMFLVQPDLVNLANSTAIYLTERFSTGVMFGGCQLALAESSAALGSLVGATPLVDDFSSYADTAALQAVWPGMSGGSGALSGGAMVVTGAGATATGVSRGFATEIGALYSIEYTITMGTASVTDIAMTNLAAGGASNNHSYDFVGAGGTRRLQFTASATTTFMQIAPRGAGNTVTIDNIRITRIVENRAALGNVLNAFFGLNVVGTITRSVVATGAELAAYGGFSAANYLEAPYNAAFDFGTGDFCFGPFWVTDNGVLSGQVIADRSHYTGGAYSGGRVFLFKSGVGRYIFRVSDGVNTTDVNGSTFTPVAGNRDCVLGLRRGNTLELWVNGIRQSSTPIGSVGSVSNASATTVIGRTHAADPAAAAYGGTIALPRIGNVAPSPDQIRAAYEIERQMFQPNAKVLMLGSASVNSLAYDADTDSLYVATPVGTNVFNASTMERTGYLQSTLAANRIDAEATLTQTGLTAVPPRSNTGGPANWGVDRYLWAMTENSATSNHLAAFPAATLTAATWVYAVPVLIGSRGWAAIRLSGGTNPILSLNTSTGANGTAGGGATALPPVNMGGGLWLMQFSFTGTAVAYTPQILGASADNTISYAGNNGVGGPALFFGKPILVQRSTALTAADYTYALSNSDNHTIVAANDGNVVLRTANGVDLIMPSISQRERATARRGLAPYDPTIGEHRGFTTDATPTNLCSIPLREGKSYQFTAEVVAIQWGGVATDRARYVVRGEVWRDIGGDIQIRTTTTTEGEVTSTMDCIGAVTASTTQAFHIRGTGRAGTRIAWAVRFVQWTDVGLAVAA